MLLSKVSDFLFFNKLFFNNVSDVNLLPVAIPYHKDKFKDSPSELGADRGFYSKENVEYAKSEGIKNVAIQKKGKSTSRDKPLPFFKRLKRLCCAIESKISLAKRKHGLNRINYRIRGGEVMPEADPPLVENLDSYGFINNEPQKGDGLRIIYESYTQKFEKE